MQPPTSQRSEKQTLICQTPVHIENSKRSRNIIAKNNSKAKDK